MTDANVSQTSAEAWISVEEDPTLRVSQISAEVWQHVDQNTLWVSQVSADVWLRINPNRLWVSQVSGTIWLSKAALGMTYPIYPTLPGLTYSTFWQPEFAVLTQRSSNKAEIDLAIANEPIHEFELTYSVLRDKSTYVLDPITNEFKTMMGFFLRLKANAGRFLFRNPDDYQVTGEAVATTDGTSTDYGPLQRTFGVGDNVGIETIGYIDEDEDINVYLDGILQTPDTYTIDKTYPKHQMLSFLIPPAADQDITMDFSFFYYCKFAEDRMTFEKFMHELWALNKVTLRSLRYRT